jgi:hypothetical protein
MMVSSRSRLYKCFAIYFDLERQSTRVHTSVAEPLQAKKKRVCVTYSIVSPLRSSLRPTSQASISGIRKSRYHFPHTHNELAIRNLEIVLVRPHTTNFTVTTRSSLNSYQPSLTSTTKFMSPVGTSSMNNV